jgi:hypothetical protein
VGVPEPVAAPLALAPPRGDAVAEAEAPAVRVGGCVGGCGVALSVAAVSVVVVTVVVYSSLLSCEASPAEAV